MTGLAVANALYELLLPVAIKEGLYDGAELVLVVDRESGRYPWELLARRRGDKIEPLVRRVRVIRQFRATDFREALLPARTRHALVVGNPSGSTPSLAGAERECEEVDALLERHGYTVEFSKQETSAAILQKLFLSDYRILHLTAHGEYRPGEPARSGVVIGPAQERDSVVRELEFLEVHRTSFARQMSRGSPLARRQRLLEVPLRDDEPDGRRRSGAPPPRLCYVGW